MSDGYQRAELMAMKFEAVPVRAQSVLSMVIPPVVLH